MKIDDWLFRAEELLKTAGVPTARLDALILLEDATSKDRAWLLAHPDFELEHHTLERLSGQIERRARHEPLAYIRGKSEFYGREFKVTPATLQPRPETETMIELVKPLKNIKFAADIGTGSGCIAITLKLERPDLEVYATEINVDALSVAEDNARHLSAGVEFYKGNLLEPIFDLHPAPDVLLCNLPYVPDSHTINQAAMQEPAIAIFGGSDGLDLYRELFAQLNIQDSRHKAQSRTRLIFTETLPFQHRKLEEIAKQAGYKLKQTEDFIQVFSL